MFIASLCFFLTFSMTRLLTHASRWRENPIQLVIGGVHVHHLVWGILILLVVGYLWLIQADHASDGSITRLGRITAAIYGLGAALTLDEFALWLRLDDVYWEREGRASVDAALMFGALVSAGLWGGPFLRAIGRQLARLLRRKVTEETTPSPLAVEPIQPPALESSAEGPATP